MSEIVYVLINQAMPGYVKIGLTKNSLKSRMKSLDTTSVPLPFECYYACTVDNCDFVEKQIHDAFLDHKVRSNREFFEISPERARAVLKLVELKDVTPEKDYVESDEDQIALNKARTKRARFNFTMVNIPPGSELEWIRDRTIKAIVHDEKYIEFNGEIMSLSKAVAIALGRPKQACQGPRDWLYKGKSLDEIRCEIEDGN